MTGRRVSDGDMPNFSRRTGQDTSGIPDAALAALLAAGTPPADPSLPVQHVADALAALRAEPASDEAAGKAAALAQFRQRVGVSSQPIRPLRRRPTLLSSLLSAKAAAAAAVAAVSLGGVATAAFANALPSAAQQFAHDTIGAPSPHSSHSANNNTNAGHSGTPVGPNASGPAAFGLCTAYASATQHGTAAQKSVAFRNLEKAAGGAANVASFCSSVAHPGASATPQTGAPASHPTGAPTSLPTGESTSHPSGPPSPHPTGPPANNG
jgi:hypothetical protein